MGQQPAQVKAEVGPRGTRLNQTIIERITSFQSDQYWVFLIIMKDRGNSVLLYKASRNDYFFHAFEQEIRDVLQLFLRFAQAMTNGYIL
jgi:hypothetical protein